MKTEEIEHLACLGDISAQVALRLLVLQRDGYICQDCGERAQEIHHIISRGHKLAWSLRNMITLCAKCHRMANKGGGAHSKDARRRHLRYLRGKYGYEYKEPVFLSVLMEADDGGDD